MTVTVPDILGSLFNPSDEVCFRIFDDKKTGTFRGLKLTCECGKYKAIEDTLTQHNQKGRGIFFVVNYGGQEDKAITRINAQFFEMDDGTFEEQQAKIDAFPLKPSMIIQTRKSLHTYFFMDGTATVERFRPIQKQLVAYFGGDPACVNESRVMRLPGFYHQKTDTPVMVQCIAFHPERKYTQDQLEEALPALEETGPVVTQSGTSRGLALVQERCAFIQHCRDDAATLSEQDWYAMIMNLAPFVGGTEAIHTLSQSYPGYTYQATQRKINHFLDSGTRPMTCKTIAEKGYPCPKLLDGSCQAKSPAALQYQPVAVADLEQLLAAIPVVGDATADLQAAHDFVLSYLYNQDEVIAEVFIQEKIRQKFKLKLALLKPLLTAYKKEHKRYEGKQEAKQRREGCMLPPWYTLTDSGNVRFHPGLLAAEMAEKEPIIYAAEQYFRYQGGVYQELSELEARRLVQDKMIPMECKMGQIIDAEQQWRLQIQCDLRNLNANPYIINVLNGLYNVLDDTLSPHTPEYYSTVQLQVSYNPEADCPRFKQFLAEAMCGDRDQVRLIQEMLGYFLIPVNAAQKSFVIVGVAGAGKSVLLRVLNDVLLGKKNVSNVSWQALNERFKTAELFGKLANIFADLPTKNIDDNGIFKALVGEDYLTVEKKNRNPFSFQCSARLLFSCNTIPRNYGDKSDGFYRRLIIIRFKHTVPPDQRDPELLDTFRMEADGIFTFALEGLRRLMAHKFQFSETQVNRDELEKYREESDSVLSFVREYCVIDAEDESGVGSTELYNRYKSYCEECGLKPYSQKTLVQQLTTSFSITRKIDQTGRRRVLTGIRLQDVLD